MTERTDWEDLKATQPMSEDDREAYDDEARITAFRDLVFRLRTEAGLTQAELAERMGTTQSVISRLEEGGGARNRIDTLARVATALDRHLVVSFPETVPANLKDAVQVA